MLYLILACAMTATAVSAEAELMLVARSAWQAQPTKGAMTPMELPLARAVISHTAGSSCGDDQSCATQVRNIQSYLMSNAGYADIAYHYLIGGNGRVYEGRSADKQPAIAVGKNAGSLAIAFIGDFDKAPPTDAALAAVQPLLSHAVSQGQLVENYELLGHRQISPTKSPGDALYALVQQWPHWISK